MQKETVLRWVTVQRSSGQHRTSMWMHSRTSPIWQCSARPRLPASGCTQAQSTTPNRQSESVAQERERARERKREGGECLCTRVRVVFEGHVCACVRAGGAGTCVCACVRLRGRRWPGPGQAAGVCALRRPALQCIAQRAGLFAGMARVPVPPPVSTPRTPGSRRPTTRPSVAPCSVEATAPWRMLRAPRPCAAG